MEQLLIQRWARLTSRFERTGPEFRLLTDLPSGGVLKVKGITADRQLVENFLDLEPFVPFDVDLQASFNRNNLDNDDIVEQTRQAWYTANVGIKTPRGWPRPRVRGTIIDTVSVPGSSLGARPSQSRAYSVRPELSHLHYGMNFTEFFEYRADKPMEDKDIYSTEEEWAAGTRMATTLLDRILVSPHYTYRVKDEYEYTFVDQQLRRPPVDSVSHEAGLSTSTRLWSTASVGLGYTFLHGKLLDTRGSGRIVPVEGHSGDASFTWPYTCYSRDKRRKLTLFPGVYAHITDLRGGIERRPSLSSQLSIAYEQIKDWKAEVRGEFFIDKDEDPNSGELRTEQNRIWFLWTAQWRDKGQPLSFPSLEGPWVSEEIPRNNVWELGPEFYYYDYEEPDFGVEFKGPMIGLAGSFTHHNPSRLMFRAEARGATGKVDYTGSGTIDGIRDYVGEGRLLGGYEFPAGEARAVTPFLGVGYRYLYDNFGGRVSSTGASSYDRESNYFYSPLGAIYEFSLGGGWKIGWSGEYDLFWRGRQESHLEDVHPSLNTLSNTQTRGHGARGAVKLQKAGRLFDLLVQPYLRWWKIEDSEQSDVTFGGTPIASGFEPTNETFEFGGDVRLRF